MNQNISRTMPNIVYTCENNTTLPPDITTLALVSSGRSLLLSSCDTHEDKSFFTSDPGALKKKLQDGIIGMLFLPMGIVAQVCLHKHDWYHCTVKSLNDKAWYLNITRITNYTTVIYNIHTDDVILSLLSYRYLLKLSHLTQQQVRRQYP